MKGKNLGGSYYLMVVLLIFSAFYILQKQGFNSLVDMTISSIFVAMFVAVIIKGVLLGKE